MAARKKKIRKKAALRKPAREKAGRKKAPKKRAAKKKAKTKARRGDATAARKEARRPTRSTVPLSLQVHPETKESIRNLAETLGTTQRVIVSRAVAMLSSSEQIDRLKAAMAAAGFLLERGAKTGVRRKARPA